MSGAVFLLIAVVISVLGSLALWLRHSKPTSLESSVDNFTREMKALAPRDDPASPARRPEERKK